MKIARTQEQARTQFRASVIWAKRHPGAWVEVHTWVFIDLISLQEWTNCRVWIGSFQGSRQSSNFDWDSCYRPYEDVPYVTRFRYHGIADDYAKDHEFHRRSRKVHERVMVW